MQFQKKISQKYSRYMFFISLFSLTQASYAVPDNIGVSGDLSTDTTIIINGTGFTSKINAKPLFWWKADFGSTPSSLGRTTSWATPFYGTLSTNVVALRSQQSAAFDHGLFKGAALGRVDFTSDKIYLFRKLYEDFDITKDTAIRTWVDTASLTGEIIVGDVITGQQSGATATVINVSNIDTPPGLSNIFYSNIGGTINQVPPVDFIFGETMTSSSGVTMANAEPYSRTGTSGTPGVNFTFNYKTIRFWNRADLPGGAASSTNNNIYFGSQGAELPAYAFRRVPEHTDKSIDINGFQKPLFQLPHQWHIDEIEYRSSSAPDVKDGKWNFYQNGILATNESYITRTLLNPHPASDTPDPEGYQQIFQSQVSNGAQPGSVAYYDELYIDDSWHRVVICQEKSLDKCKQKAVLIPIEWSDTQIKVQVNTGSFNPKSPLYLYVIDENGISNTSGYQLCPLCPLPPIIK